MSRWHGHSKRITGSLASHEIDHGTAGHFGRCFVIVIHRGIELCDLHRSNKNCDTSLKKQTTAINILPQRNQPAM